MKIPSIEFSASNPAAALIEIIDLHELYRRKDRIDHNPEKPHRVGFSMLIYIQQGSGSHFIDFARWPFEKGSFIFVNKDQINAFDLSERPQGNAILFTDEFIQRIQSNMKMPVFSPSYLKHDYSPVLQTSVSLQESCERLLLEIKTESLGKHLDSLVTMFLFSALFLMLERERSSFYEQRLSNKEHKTYSNFINLLEKQFTQTRNASDYATQLHVTYKALNQLCKRATELTAKQLIDAYIILEAKRRLVVEQKNVQELAYELGFDEVTNFTKYFKKHTRLLPSHFQRNP